MTHSYRDWTCSHQQGARFWARYEALGADGDGTGYRENVVVVLSGASDFEFAKFKHLRFPCSRYRLRLLLSPLAGALSAAGKRRVAGFGQTLCAQQKGRG